MRRRFESSHPISVAFRLNAKTNPKLPKQGKEHKMANKTTATRIKKLTAHLAKINASVPKLQTALALPLSQIIGGYAMKKKLTKELGLLKSLGEVVASRIEMFTKENENGGKTEK